MLSVEQKIFLVQCYGTGVNSYNYVQERFLEKFPGVYVSTYAIRQLIKKFKHTGSVENLKRKKKLFDEDDAATVVVLQSVEENPLVSLRKRAQHLLIVQKSQIQIILKQNKFHPFKPHFNHALEDGDHAKRLDFCLWVGDKILNENNQFHKLILFTDESTFSTNGTVASQHVRYWSTENPQFRIPAHRQYFKKVNVWCGISYFGIIGPFFFENTCNRNSYMEMLQTFFSDKLDELPLQYRGQMYFQQDGCPAHCAREVTEWLNMKFGNRWIGRYGPVMWPARSPDLTISDAYLWGRLKQLTFQQPIECNVDILKQRILQSVQMISLEEVRRSYDHIRRQFEQCVENGGGVFE